MAVELAFDAVVLLPRAERTPGHAPAVVSPLTIIDVGI
jgi:hypothetical protein